MLQLLCVLAVRALKHAHTCMLPTRRNNEDEARDTFKTLKNQHLGQSAHLYCEWARLEASSGNTSKAQGIVHKGLKEGAQPARWGGAQWRPVCLF